MDPYELIEPAHHNYEAANTKKQLILLFIAIQLIQLNWRPAVQLHILPLSRPLFVYFRSFQTFYRIWAGALV